MRILDTNILVYSLLEEHPATKECRELIKEYLLKSTLTLPPTVPLESYAVLRKYYGLIEGTREKIRDFMRLPNVIVHHLDEGLMDKALKVSQDLGTGVGDGVIIATALVEKIPIILTDDVELQKLANQFGIKTETPISQETREKMRRWEEKHLPEKGLQRILFMVYSWLEDKSREIAEEFKNATEEFKKLP